MSEYSEIDGLPPSFFEEKRTNYIANLKRRFAYLNENSIFVLQGADAPQKYDSDVSYFYFGQESNFYYLTGVRFPHMRAIIDFQNSKCDLFYAKEDDENQISHPVPTKEEIEAKYGIPTHYMSEFNNFICRRNPELIYILSGYNDSGLPVFSADLHFEGELEYLNQRISHEEMIYKVLCETRMIKTDSERELLKYTGKISTDAVKEMMKNIKPDMMQREMENIFLNYLRKNFNTRFYAFAPIAVSGTDNSVLHYMLNDKKMNDGDLFLSDMGIQLCGYDSDISCTFPVNGKFTDEQRDIYNVVLNSNRAVFEKVRAGEITKKEVDTFSKKKVLEGLKELGILTPLADIDDLFNKGMARIFYPHGYGHYLGLDCHDVGTQIEHTSMQIIRNGMFITNEPGCYFNEMLLQQARDNPELCDYIDWDRIEKYKYVGGVRIEDDLMYFDDHVECYTKDIPRTVEEIEEFMAKNNPYCRKNKLQ